MEERRKKMWINCFLNNFFLIAALESVRNEILEKNQHVQLQNEELNKANEKIKPYWYIDPSIVYRAMTSPVI